MNENHQRYLLSTFRNLDRLLSDSEQVFTAANSSSPFVQYSQAATPLQQKVFSDSIRRLRETMMRSMAELQLPLPGPICGSLWAARGHLASAGIALGELEPERMGGYGSLSCAESAELKSIGAELSAALQRLTSYLDQGPDADLESRMARLDQGGEQLPLLRELERVITKYGLIEFRGALEILLDRLENETFEVGIFGRVSAGKSSFLNYLLGSKILPTGSTPVTAIPTRVRLGPKPNVLVDFAEGKSVQIGLDRLAEYTTEQQNPGNRLHVSRITVEVPAGRLRPGVTFVDTPGPGSLAAGGAEETAAYLPRCDLGLVLVDAASTLTQADLMVLQALHQSGASAMLLVSKADLLEPEEYEATFRYAQQQLEEQLGIRVRLFPISVRGPQTRLCDEWFEKILKPRLDSHRELALLSVSRKVEGLRLAVVHTLERRAAGRDARVLGLAGVPSETEALTRLRNALSGFGDARRRCEELVDTVPGLSEPILQAGGRELALHWKEQPTVEVDSGRAFATALARVLAGHTSKLRAELELAREGLVQAITHARSTLKVEMVVSEPLPKLAELPSFESVTLGNRLALRKPPLIAIFGTGPLASYAHGRLHEGLASQLSEFLSLYGQRLRSWLYGSMRELGEAFAASAGPLRAQLQSHFVLPPLEVSETTLEADLQLLREWRALRA